MSCATTKYNSKYKTPHLEESLIANIGSSKNIGSGTENSKIRKETLSDYHFMVGEISSLEGKSEKAITHLKLASLYKPHTDIFHRAFRGAYERRKYGECS